MRIEFYTDRRETCPVRDFLKYDQLSPKDKKKIINFLMKVENYEDDRLTGFFHSKNATAIKGRNHLYEFRPFPCRIFFTLYGNVCWLLHIIVKKRSGPAPKKEIIKADLRKEEIMNKY